MIEHFGREILLPDHQIDRKRLGNLIFQNESQRKILNEITHPIIIQRTMEQAKVLGRRYPQVIVDIPLLFESKRENLFDLIIVVYVPLSLQITRLMIRDQISEKEAVNKINSQMKLEKKKERADLVIFNDKGVKETEEQVKRIIENWKRLGT
ncbi:dephospho-CoA kinase [Tepidibacillus marianensis]|uniref:dephospho-CoA kinase n=1 Tax=Tepidibacillus marianensis TaxID=3131995 RepID=UPI0030D589EC